MVSFIRVSFNYIIIRFPKIEGKFSTQIDKKTVSLSLEQVQKPPFNKSFDITLEVELIDSDGISYHQNLEFNNGKAFATFSIGESKIKIIRVDPNTKVLFTLDMNPGEEILESSAKEAADIFTRIWAYGELIKIGTHSSFSRIAKHIYSEPFYGVRIYVAKALSKALFSEARKILGQMLIKEKDHKAMYRIASECQIVDHGMRNDLLEFLKSPKLPYQAKAAALEALGHQKCYEDVDFLLKIAKEPGADRHGIVCSGAIRGLGASRSSKAFDFLLASLDTPAAFHERVRAFIIPSLASLARWMDPRSRSVNIVTERFLSILPNEEKQRVRFNIVKGLVTLEARSALSSLNSAGNLFDSRHFYAVKEEIQKLRESGGLSVSELLTSLEKVESRLLTLESKYRELAEQK